MSQIQEEILKLYGNKLRIRVVGLLIEDNQLLLIKHLNIGNKKVLWSPPGGGIEYGESAKDALKREFKEETGLDVEVLKMLFVHEFCELPLHAIELFFEVRSIGGNLKLGTDPEMGSSAQIIQEICFMDMETIKSQIEDRFHDLIDAVNSFDALVQLNGYYRNGKRN